MIKIGEKEKMYQDMRLSEDTLKGFRKLDNYVFDYNYYVIGKEVSFILKELEIKEYILQKWMKYHGKTIRKAGEAKRKRTQHKIKLFVEQETEQTIYDKYIIEEKSIVDLQKEYKVSYRFMEAVLKYCKIPVRNIKEACQTNSRQNKIVNYLQKHYGEDITNVSQIPEVKEAKEKTFMENYGVDNIFKDQEFINSVDSIMLEKYGKKRLNNPEKASESRRKFFQENGPRAQKIRKESSDRAKRTNALLSKDELNKKMFEMRRKIPIECRSSSLEYRIKDILDQNNIWYVHQFFSYPYSFDFFFGHKLLLEIQGDYWHCNPNQYSATDSVKHGADTVLVADVWEKDNKKRLYMEEKGFAVLYLWETEINNLTDVEICHTIQEYIQANW